ncbi:MAG: CARDB domain-containing protein [Chloroflexota bacterium]|nr:CARDB domain-containing protein [Chloroflexota bacterium]
MRLRKFPLFMLALILLTSLSIVGCGGASATFELSNFNVPASVTQGEQATITVEVSNTGEASGTYTATLTIDGTSVGSQDVTLEAEASQTVTFTYTPSATGAHTAAIGELSETFSVIEVDIEGYWSIPYEISGGQITLRVSLLGGTPETKVVPLSTEQSGSIVLQVAKAKVDGAREVIIAVDDWMMDPAPVTITGVSMTIYLNLYEDATGTLYVEDGVGDVDMSSESAAGRDPIQEDTYGDGTMDAAGSMVLDSPLLGLAVTVQDVELPFDFVFTTGHAYNIVSRPDKGLDGAVMESDGVPFAKDGGPADYVGTAGTIATTGTGDCLNLTLVGFTTDFQTEIQLELTPVE